MADDEAPELDPEALREQLAALGVGDFLLSADSTLASLAFAKLERGDLPEARKAIDALVALVPHVEGPLAGELRRTLADLQVRFAQSTSA